MEIIDTICGYIITAMTLLTAYQFVYAAIGFFCRPKAFAPAKENHSYGIIISARNESKVIGKLLDSIEKQDYDMSLVRVFVVADNCTDDTADICRSHGAVVYERNDPAHARKGWAMGYLFDCIERDYGITSLDGYIVFDADNLLARDYITQINRAFDTGPDIVTGYRNTKNFDTNFISAAYGIHFCRSSALMHRPRVKLGLSTHIAGTGYAVNSRVLADGWKFFSLTEDTEFTLTSVSQGKKIEFCEAAEFFDEQPYEFKVMFRQRLRWEKGRLFCFFRCAGRIFSGIFRRGTSRFSCYDMFFYAFPKGMFSAFLSLIYPASVLIAGGFDFSSSDPGAMALNLLSALGVSYVTFVAIGAITVIRERRKIRCSTGKLILYTLAFPWFDLLGLPIAITSLFMRVKWKPIKHDRDLSIDQIPDKK